MLALFLTASGLRLTHWATLHAEELDGAIIASAILMLAALGFWIFTRDDPDGETAVATAPEPNTTNSITSGRNQVGHQIIAGRDVYFGENPSRVPAPEASLPNSAVTQASSTQSSMMETMKPLKNSASQPSITHPAPKPSSPPVHQVSLTPAAPPSTVTINAPNGIGISGGTVFNPTVNNGYIPPPARVISQQRFDAAVSILETAPAGSKVHFHVVGGNAEINSFMGQLQELFKRAGDKWTITGRDASGILSNSVFTDAGLVVHHGEGLNCNAGAHRSQAFDIAIKALNTAGLACGDQNIPKHDYGDDIYIMVGSRIVPE